ncbi:hypothetical protein [Nonomuraea typhae]|uniref:hypothetical protein n=1 Tax=Nonomuraea typhae TaxID=2603600 RepID=UPI0012FB6EBE|nr:hypothetical protein [Nonomuraea typhae]
MRGRRVLSVVSAVVLALTAPVISSDLPTPRQALEVFRDMWGPSDFRLRGVGTWQPESVWHRVEPQYGFAPGTDEFTSAPEVQRDLIPLRLEVFSRERRHRTEYQVIETATRDGREIPNYFPVFSGTPSSMVFYNAVTLGPANEVEERCREFVKGGRRFQLCRAIHQATGVTYHVKVRQGEPARDLPAVREVLGAFRDQWGRDSFRSPGVGGWQLAESWRAVRALVFPDGENELTADPVVRTPGQGGSVTLDFQFYRRTVPGGPDEFQVILRVNDGAAFSFFPPFFRGAPPETVFQFENRRTFPDPPTNERLHSRPLTVDGRGFLVVRVVHAGGRVNYWVAEKL